VTHEIRADVIGPNFLSRRKPDYQSPVAIFAVPPWPTTVRSKLAPVSDDVWDFGLAGGAACRVTFVSACFFENVGVAAASAFHPVEFAGRGEIGT
jgi:hypothetical protein